MPRTYLFRLIACDLATAGASHWSPLGTSEGATTTLWLVSLATGLATVAWITARGVTHAYPDTFNV